MEKCYRIFHSQEGERVSELRDLSILPVFSKVLEKIANVQKLQKINILPPDNLDLGTIIVPTNTALLGMVDEMLNAIDNSNVTIAVILDYTKAFDSIDHKLLLAKLKFYHHTLTQIRPDLRWSKKDALDKKI